MGSDAPARGTLRAVLAQRAFTRFLCARFAASLAVQMQSVAVGVQVYGLTHNPLDLGLIGLSQFLPFVGFVLIAGHAADRRDRKRIVLLCIAVQLLCAVALAAFTTLGLKNLVPLFAVMIVFGVTRSFMGPASNALVPNLVPIALFGNAVAINSSAWQVATIVGPALGGILYAAAGPAPVYATVAVLLGVAVACLAGLRAPRSASSAEPLSWASVVEGLRFVWRREVVLGAISMDLFAVLFGGATALLPAYAADVLHVGADGLGWLRAAPGIGAAITAAGLTVRPVGRRVGATLFAGVATFGTATIVFGVSTSFWASLVALSVLGAADMVSVFVRQMLVQLETPDDMRGRVSAVNWMFIGASNEFGEFESGVTAAWWGLKPAVVVGGIATLAVAALWARWFPKLRDLDRFR
ncbi:MAG TPA: MFS transporter [Steroidobacteraceae bacterium]|nr:MFS transporter [Steroidobacteraceae bacterium]